VIEVVIALLALLYAAYTLWRASRRRPEEYYTAEFSDGVEKIQVLDVTRGSTLVIQTPRRIPRDMFLRLKAQLRAEHDVKLIILEGGMSLSAVLNPEEALHEPE
jgi:hypothetical protein